MIANPQQEMIKPEDLAARQLELLKKQVKWAAEKSRFYREKFTAAGVTAKTIQSLEDIENLPVTESLELAGRAYDRLTMPLSSVLRMGRAEGQLAFYGQGDIGRHVETMTRALVAAGLHNASVAALIGDLADSRLLDVQYALEFVGAAVFAAGADAAAWSEALDVGADTLIGFEADLVRLEETLRAQGETIADAPCRRIICLQPDGLTSNHRGKWEREGKKVTVLYAPASLGAAGFFYPCSEGGCHLAADYYLAELLDEEGDAADEGELYLTSLQAEAMPLLRWRTGIYLRRVKDPCDCGRTAPCYLAFGNR